MSLRRHTSVFSFTMFNATTVLCNSIKDCLKVEMSRNYPWILKIHLENIGIFLQEHHLRTIVLFKELSYYCWWHVSSGASATSPEVPTECREAAAYLTGAVSGQDWQSRGQQSQSVRLPWFTSRWWVLCVNHFSSDLLLNFLKYV